MIRSLTLSLVLGSVLAGACGDNLEPSNQPDAGPDAPGSSVRAVVVTPSANFEAGQPGVLSVADVEARTIMPNVGPAMAIGNDPVIRKIGNELYIVNRGTNNVTILDAADYSLIEQLATGVGTNPQDVAVVDDRLFVVTFGNKGMVELRRGFPNGTEIDLSFDDPDGKPNCNSVYRINNELYVACELLDDTQQFLPPRGNGKVYVVNPNTRTITRTITLMNKNPFNLLTQIPNSAPNAGDLVIGTVDFATGEGCLERIAVGANPSSAGCVLTNAQLGGYATRVGYYPLEFLGPVTAIVIPPILWVVVSKPDFTTEVRTYDLTEGTLSPPISMPSHAPMDLAVCPSGEVVVSDAPFGGSGGLRIYRGAMELTTTPLPVGLNPASTAGLLCY